MRVQLYEHTPHRAGRTAERNTSRILVILARTLRFDQPVLSLNAPYILVYVYILYMANKNDATEYSERI